MKSAADIAQVLLNEPCVHDVLPTPQTRKHQCVRCLTAALTAYGDARARGTLYLAADRIERAAMAVCNLVLVPGDYERALYITRDGDGDSLARQIARAVLAVADEEHAKRVAALEEVVYTVP